LYLIEENHATEDTIGRLQIFPENDHFLGRKDIILKLRPKYFKCSLGMKQEKNGEKWEKKNKATFLLQKCRRTIIFTRHTTP